jgi:hypothetical protein
MRDDPTWLYAEHIMFLSILSNGSGFGQNVGANARGSIPFVHYIW